MQLIDSLRGSAGKILRLSLVAAGAVLSIAAFYAQERHSAAEQFLEQVDLQSRNTSGATFYAAKKRLFIGQALSREDVVNYLKSTNFSRSETHGQSGTYVLSGNDVIEISPRLVEFQPVKITFRRGKITKLKVQATPLNSNDGEVNETAIEPEPLGAFVMSMNGDERSKMFVRRYTIPFDEFKETDLFYAILGSEDSFFMSHNGTRFDRILVNLLPWHKGGGSSITMQVVKNAVSLDTTHTITRKVDEVFLASALEQKMSKPDILTLYVNDVFLGGGKGSPNVYGFLAAAEQYFGKKSIRELTLSEVCTLVALLPKPSFFLEQAKIGDYDQLTDWRNRVLGRLHANWPDRYPTTVIESARRDEIHFVTRPYVEQPLDVLCRAFVDYATAQQPLVELGGLAPTEYSGLHIYTSADPDLMREAQRILNEAIPKVERRFPPIQQASCEDHERMLGAIVALNPKTGEIISMSGGGGGKDGVKYAKLALNAEDAPASTIKPFWVVQAISDAQLPNGQHYTAASIIDPSSASLYGWKPTSGLRGAGRPRAKLAVSGDDFATYTLSLIGLEKGKSFYEAVSGGTITNPTGQLAIGFGAGTEISPLRMALAYTVFANNGVLATPSAVGNVYLDGKEIESKRKLGKRVADAGAAYITTQMMRSVLGYGLDGSLGTARQAFARTGLSASQVEMAGKTGSGPHSVWMVSISPKLVVVVWLGYQCHSQIKNAQEMYAKDTAAEVWADFMRSVGRFRPDLIEGRFEKPGTVVEVTIDPVSGCRLEQGSGMPEFFIEGTEPPSCGKR